LEAKQKFITHTFFSLAILVGFTTFAQQPSSDHRDSAAAYIKANPGAVHQTVIIEGDTVAWDILDEILFLPEPTFNDAEARKNYLRLKRRVMKVYPYAYLTGDRLDTVRLVLDDITKKRQRKKYLKNYQKYLEENFEPELKKLTRSEGQILCKLIHRETGITVQDLITTYRGSWNAWWWTRFAEWYDIDIDEPYEPEVNAEDKLIESILNRAFKTKMLEERVPFYPPNRY